MDKSPAIILDIFIKENISQLMKQNGFLKNGKTWTKQNGDITYVMNMQSNKWNTSGAPVEIFINYGLFSPEQYREQFKLSVPPIHPKEYDCYIRKRLISSSKNNEIWTIHADGKDNSKDRIVDAIIEIIFPFFELH